MRRNEKEENVEREEGLTWEWERIEGQEWWTLWKRPLGRSIGGRWKIDNRKKKNSKKRPNGRKKILDTKMGEKVEKWLTTSFQIKRYGQHHHMELQKWWVMDVSSSKINMAHPTKHHWKISGGCIIFYPSGSISKIVSLQIKKGGPMPLTLLFL